MNATVTYLSWRTVWDRYGAAVCAVAVAVAGPANAPQLVSSSIPKAIQLGGDVLDPLEVLVAPLVTGCSGVEKARAAAVLIGFGVAHERALAVTGARSLGGPVDTADVKVASFDELLAAMDPSLEPRGVTGVDEVASARLWQWRLGVIGLVLVVAVGAGVAAFRARGGGPSDPPLLATIGAPPAPWKLVSAVARYPVLMGPVEMVAQRFRRSAGNTRVAITIVGKAAPFQGSDLGTVDSPAIDPAQRQQGALQQLRGRRVLAFSTGDWAYAEWSELGREVVLNARGMPNDALRQLIAQLQPTRSFSTEGFQIPGPGWSAVAVLAQRDVSAATFTELTFRNGNDGSTSTVSVTQSAQQVNQAGGPDPFLGDTAPPAPVRFTLRAGVTAENNSSGGGISLRWWDALRRAQVSVSSYSFQGSGPNQVEVVQLAASIRVVDRAGWDKMMAPLQTDMRKGRALQTVVLGPLELSYRLYNGANRAASTVCTPTVCALWDDSAVSGSSADLLIDGHWWHLERTGILANSPTWRTSPRMARVPQFQSAAYGRQLWRALDLGTITKALRRNDDAIAFGRPAA